MKETNAVLAGEMSGHTFFKDRYYGFDDAVYAGCRIIEIVAKHKRENSEFVVEDLLKPFDEVCTSPELRLPCPNELKKPVLEGFKQYVNENQRCFGNPIKDIITLDGMRVVFDGGFALIRQSNTEPVFTLRFEADSSENTRKYEDLMVNKLLEIIKELSVTLGIVMALTCLSGCSKSSENGKVEVELVSYKPEAVEAFEYLSRIEGIIPAIESSHAVAYARKLAPTMDKDKIIVVNISGRGDKDVAAIARYRGVEIFD